MGKTKKQSVVLFMVLPILWFQPYLAANPLGRDTDRSTDVVLADDRQRDSEQLQDRQDTINYDAGKDFAYIMHDEIAPFNISITGASLEPSKGGMSGQNITFTTCPAENPSYRLQAGLLKYDTDKKIVLKDVAYWEGSHVLFRMPTLILPLYGDPPAIFPEIGHSEDEGWYLKSRRYYDIDAGSYGEILQDYMSEKGLGIGVKLHYLLGDGEYKNYLLYGAQRLDGSRSSTKVEYNHGGQNFQQHLDLNYTGQNGNETQLAGAWSYNVWQGTYYSSNLIEYKRYGEETKITGNLQWYGKLNDRLTLDTSLYQENLFVPGGGTTLGQTIAAKLVQQGRHGDIELLTQRHTNGLDTEAQVLLHPRMEGPWRIDVGSGLLHEDSTGLRTMQHFLQGEYSTRQAPVSTHSLLHYGGMLRQEFYGTGDKPTILQTNVALETAFSARLNATLRWDVRDIQGVNPFQSLQEIPTHHISWDADYQWDNHVNTEVRWGYSLVYGVADPLTLAVLESGKPNDTQAAILQGISLVHRVWRNNISGVFSVDYDIADDRWSGLLWMPQRR
jgi:hypothetical protein